MAAPTIYCWDESTNKYFYSMEAQIDPLETEQTGKDVYCGLPVNGTYEKPLKEKEGFDVVWNGKEWEYKEQEKTPEQQIHEPTELEKAYQELWNAQTNLSATDYRTLKYVEGLYTDEEYAVYKAQREELRQAVRDAQSKVDELEGK